MIQYPLMALFAALSATSNEAVTLPQKTVATVFTLKAGTAGEQAIDLKNQFASTEKSIRCFLEAARVSWNLPVLLIAATADQYRSSWVEPSLESLLAAAKADPHDAEVASALIFFLARAPHLVEPNGPYQRAQRILLEHHCNHPAIGELATQLKHGWYDKQAIALLLKIHQTHADLAVRKIARASLACIYKDQAGWAKWHKDFGNKDPENIAFSNCATFIAAFKELDQTDPETLLAESRKYQ
jgi:hypothetical protein